MGDITLPGWPQDAPSEPGHELPFDLLSAGRGAPAQLISDLDKLYLQLLQRRVLTISIPFATQAAAFLLRPAEKRYYILIENVDAAATLFIGVGQQPVANAIGFQLNPGGSFSPAWAPQEDIWVIGSAVPTRGYMIVGNRLADV